MIEQHYRKRGKVSISKYFQELTKGDTVNLAIHPSVQKGRFFPRFHGLSGIVVGKKGFCYTVKIKDGGKEKTLFIHPIHLTKA